MFYAKRIFKKVIVVFFILSIYFIFSRFKKIKIQKNIFLLVYIKIVLRVYYFAPEKRQDNESSYNNEKSHSND